MRSGDWRAKLEDVKDIEDIGILEEIKDELCVEGSLWLKQGKWLLPTKFSMKDTKPMAKAWGRIVVHTLESCGNSSEFRLVRVVVVQAIMNDDEINIGRIITEDIRRIGNKKKKAFSYGQCGLINALCEEAKVGRTGNNLKLKRGCVLDSKWLVKSK